MDDEHRYQSVVKECANFWGMDDAQERSVHIQRTLGVDALTHVGPDMLLNAFSHAGPYTPTPANFNHKLMLIAPHWPVLQWLDKIYRMLCAQPCQLPVRKDLLSQREGMMFHMHSEELQSVFNTIQNTRAPSTRSWYDYKWGVFQRWCLKWDHIPFQSSVPVILSFSRELIDKGEAFYTIKFYLAAIAVCYIDYWDRTRTQFGVPGYKEYTQASPCLQTTDAYMSFRGWFWRCLFEPFS